MVESAITKFTFLNSWAGYLIYSWGSRESGPVLHALSHGNYLVLTLLVIVGVLRTCASVELVVVLSGSCTRMRSSFCLVFLCPHCAPQYVLMYVLCVVCLWSYCCSSSLSAFSLLVLNFVVASCWLSSGVIQLSVLLLLHARTHLNEKKK
jgi:hypothetical protein